MKKEEIKDIIVGLFNEKLILNDIDSSQDFFDYGASSLTVVDLQVKIEKALRLEVETHTLMLEPTINGWINIYTNKFLSYIE